jgi:hypothetical protein
MTFRSSGGFLTFILQCNWRDFWFVRWLEELSFRSCARLALQHRIVLYWLASAENDFEKLMFQCAKPRLLDVGCRVFAAEKVLGGS